MSLSVDWHSCFYIGVHSIIVFPQKWPVASWFNRVQFSLEDEGWKPLIMPTGFFRLYNSYNRCPCTRPAHVALSEPLARHQVLQNSGSLILMLRVKTLSAWDCHWRKLRERNFRELCLGSGQRKNPQPCKNLTRIMCDSRMAVRFFTHTTCNLKMYDTNQIPCASVHWLAQCYA